MKYRYIIVTPLGDIYGTNSLETATEHAEYHKIIDVELGACIEDGPEVPILEFPG